MQHTFFPLAKNNFALVFWQREISRNFLVTRFMEEMLYVFLAVDFFSLPGSLSPLWQLAYPLFLTAALNFFVFLPTKLVSFGFYLSL